MTMAKAKILLVEDEAHLVRILRFNLKKEGFNFLSAKNGKTGLEMALKQKPNLVIADIMLPSMDGLEMLRALRQESQVPVIFLTAKRAEIDRILGFNLGADDYLSKPFSIRELICRVKAVLHRLDRQAGARSHAIRIGGLEVNFDRHEVRVNGKYRHLAPREFKLLTMLIELNGEVISREQLLKRIWGIDKSMEISTRTVDQHVARLRRGLLSEKRRIITVKNIGYRIRTD
jgi:DNA-binding response OmpR family regulator